jgi:hypothetical protein
MKVLMVHGRHSDEIASWGPARKALLPLWGVRFAAASLVATEEGRSS